MPGGLSATGPEALVGSAPGGLSATRPGVTGDARRSAWRSAWDPAPVRLRRGSTSDHVTAAPGESAWDLAPGPVLAASTHIKSWPVVAQST